MGLATNEPPHCTDGIPAQRGSPPAIDLTYLTPEQMDKPWDWTGILQNLDFSESLDLSFLSHLDGTAWNDVDEASDPPPSLSSLTWQHIVDNWQLQWPAKWRYRFPQSTIWPIDEAEKEDTMNAYYHLHPEFICAHIDSLNAAWLSENLDLPLWLVRKHVSTLHMASISHTLDESLPRIGTGTSCRNCFPFLMWLKIPIFPGVWRRLSSILPSLRTAARTWSKQFWTARRAAACTAATSRDGQLL